MLENTKGAIKNGQSRETGNIENNEEKHRETGNIENNEEKHRETGNIENNEEKHKTLCSNKHK